MEKAKNHTKRSQVPNVAAQRRASKGGQIRRNFNEKPAEENRDPVPASRTAKGRAGGLKIHQE
jgi:hypothetical protein